MGRGSSKAGGGGGQAAANNLNLSRAQESARAMRLQEALGSGYRVEYDSGDSGLTRFYYNQNLYREVPNGEMSSARLDVNEYAAPRELLMGQTQRAAATQPFKSRVQSDYVNYVREQIGVDLGQARDTQFDTRRYFNIDVRDLGGGNVETGNLRLRQLRTLNSRSSTYDVQVEPNGQYRYAISVKKK